MPEKKHPGGRPSKYTKSLGEKICKKIAEGDSIKKIAEGANMPGRSTIFNWLIDHEEFLDLYARSKDIQLESLMDELYEMCDLAIKDPTKVQAYKLKIDSLKWHISKLKPQKYGDKQEIIIREEPEMIIE